jgi:ATP-dependent DNA helicase DinG
MLSKYLNKFPHKYNPSKQQIKLIREIEHAFNQGYKYVICSAPTGSGKSFISKTLANVSNEPSDNFRQLVESYEALKVDNIGNFTNELECMDEDPCGAFALTITKSLQDQYLQLFDDSAIMKGKSNYQSTLDPNIDVEMESTVMPKKVLEDHRLSNKCPYHNARNKGLLDKFGVLNYKMFLSLPNHVKRKNFIICDEASEIEDEIVKQYSIFIDPERLKLLGVKIPNLYSVKHESVHKWISIVMVTISEYVNTLTNRTNNKQIKLSSSDNIKLTYLKNLHRTLNLIDDTWNECEYVVHREGKTVKVMPLKIDVLSKYIFNHGEKILLMSATIIDHKHFAKNLGIDKYKYIEVDSTFDSDKSPIYVNTKNKINHYNLKKQLPKIVKQIESICEDHEFDKGIIHTHTSFIANYLKNNLRSKRFLYRDETTRNEEILAKHSKSKNPTVLVSPSLGLGIDLRDDLARFQIIIKAPYLPLGDKRIKKLFDLDKQWYTNKMLSNVVQQCGRGIRSKQDHCKTYILDAGVFEAIIKNKNKLPKYFIDRFV